MGYCYVTNTKPFQISKIFNTQTLLSFIFFCFAKIRTIFLLPKFLVLKNLNHFICCFYVSRTLCKGSKYFLFTKLFTIKKC